MVDLKDNRKYLSIPNFFQIKGYIKIAMRLKSEQITNFKRVMVNAQVLLSN
jgi:hypothetical protein